MQRDQRQRCRRHAFDAVGVTDRARFHRAEFLPQLERQPRDDVVIERARNRQRVFAAEAFDIFGLPDEIDRILRINLKLLDDLRIKA
jgi:hypothetical protein